MNLAVLGSLLDWRSLTSPVVALVAVGLAVISVKSLKHTESSARVTVVIGMIALCAVAYSYVVQYARSAGHTFPTVVPAFHFLYYLGAVSAICFGVGCVWLARTVTGGVTRITGSRSRHVAPAVAWSATFVLAVAIAVRMPTYRMRTDFTDFPQSSAEMFADPGLRDMQAWLFSNTDDQDVFLASDALGQSVIATAGRKVVAVSQDFSNPYVAWRPRRADRDEMFARILAGDGGRLSELALKYTVKYVASDEIFVPASLDACHLRRVWQSHQWSIYRFGD
jgi:hypothetical protein